MPLSLDWECDSASSSSSDSSLDEDQLNARLSPHWPTYRDLILSRGYQLDTVRDVREYYRHHGLTSLPLCGYTSAHTFTDDRALCKDPGLPENLFRAICCTTGIRLMIKAVNRLSREVQNVRHMSSPPLRHHPMNHSIPILDIIDVPAGGICFIVMEEWSSHLFPEIPSKLRDFLSAIHQCIEHIAFMHRNHIVHLDISLHNFLTDYRGRCACIDYELSQRVDDLVAAGTCWPKGTEVPPELERGQVCNPYMIDVWALAILILRACKIGNLYIPELLHLTAPMLNHNPDRRPTVAAVLREFKRLILLMGEERLDQPC
ncbi:kinase-like domain-containing protein [Boletus edulis BED1]|uniref:Kinase-like domain-containing protein n=1 Tax=Boletus edulis BED1 TaxID=1328754 RepID=A0AAD4C576_BOLED|nr:kinase-like domain-containing protein [Boletus edulis BED1]